MKICVKCQKEFPDDMAFCSYCGIPLQPKIEERACPACRKVVHADNLRFCPYCGFNFNPSDIKAQTHTKPPLPSNVNIKKNYVKMQPLGSSNNNENELSWKDKVFQGGLITFFVYCVIALVLNGFIYNIFLFNICLAIIMFNGWSTVKEYFQTKSYLPLIATILIFIITIGILGVMKSVAKEQIRKRVSLQHPVLIVDDIALLK